jgi:uncharacterized protein
MAPGSPATPDATPEPPPPPPPPAPVAESERVTELDVVRGFALLGILLMNIEYFTRPLQGIALGLDRSLSGLDYAAGWTIMTFVQGKFYTLFSMLFGMGFAIQMERATARGDRFGRRFLRRLVALALIGAVHGYLIWAGDILLVYALVGSLLLLFFRKTPVSRLPKWGIALILLPTLALWGMVTAVEMAKLDPKAAVEVASDLEKQNAEMMSEYAEAAETYAHASWSELLPRRVADMGMQLRFLPVFGWSILGMFALGAWFVRSGRIVRAAEHRPFFRRLCAVGLGVGAPLAVLAMSSGAADGMTDISWRFARGQTLMGIAALLLSLGYLSGIVLLVGRPGASPRFRPVARAGQMALTNYLLQSVLCTTLFYGYGFGLFGRVPRAQQVLLVLVVWALNVAFSVWWLNRFRFGPAEWLWRSLTYGRAQPMRLVSEAAAARRPS